MLIAKVVVDVATGETNQLYDYIVPVEWEKIVERGMRVGVPFGNRYVLGYIIDLTAETAYPVHKLKPLAELLDASPVLTEELLALGNWLSETTLSLKVTAYQAMIPAALKGKVDKQFVLTDGPVPEEVRKYFGKRKIIPFAEMINDKSAAEKINDWLKNEYIQVRYTVKNKVAAKKEKIISINGTDEEIEKFLAALHKRSEKQRQLLLYMKEHKEVPLRQIIENNIATRTTVKTLIEKKILIESEREVYRHPYADENEKRPKKLDLTKKQQKVLAPILQTIENHEHRTFLLHGVTGSGKTEIYMQAIERVLKKGKEAIILVPEISLTPQMVARFKGRFGKKVAVMHSGLSVGEKYDEWRKMAKKEVSVVVGARSAIFAPFTNIGIIIIDEEHEASYKQEESPKYHARDVAIYRAKYHSCPVVLGSATPSLESYARALKGRYELLTLNERVNQMQLPKVHVVDMREELRDGNRSMFSRALFEKMVDRLKKNEQIVLFLNRRGHSTFVMCRDCGYVPACPHCDISFTYHKTNHSLHCHYCGKEERFMNVCPSCQSPHIRFFGAGTQKVEEQLAKILPEARVIRMDVDTTRKKGAHEKLLNRFAKGEGDILLGTQMIAKGLDFPNVTLVGVLAADSMLYLPDFRAAERTFQLLMQVSGRAGRHELAGEVIIQTYTPNHYSIEYVKRHDYEKFFYHEMQLRKANGYPPYYYLTIVTVSHPELKETVQTTEKISRFLKNELSKETAVLGPVASPIVRLKDRYRYQCMIKYKNEPKLNEALKKILTHFRQEIHRGELQISIDPNPIVIL